MAPTQIPENKARSGRASKAMTSMAFIVSVVVHVVIFLLVGSVVIFEGTIPPNLFTSMSREADEAVVDEIELPPVMEDELEPEPLETLEDELAINTEVDLSEAMNTSDLIISSAVDPTFSPTFSQPTLNIGTDTGTRIMGGNGTGNSSGVPGPGGLRTADIFGRKVAASNFGAILDISGSTHTTIDVAVDEIKTGFPDAILVLVAGCGMDPRQTGKVVNGKDFEKNIRKYHYQGKDDPHRLYAAAFLEKLLDKNKNFKKVWERAVRDERGYVLHLDLHKKPGKNADGEPSITKIRGTQHAFDFLIKEKCDVIYWMADFEDPMDPEIANDVGKDLRRKKIKLIQHDFNGMSESDQVNLKVMKDLIRKTGGESIMGKN